MAKKTRYTADGKDFQNGKFIDKELSFDLPNPPQTAGLPISAAAFQNMVNGFDPGPLTTTAVTFSKEALLTVLSQYGCAGIKFYFAVREDESGKRLTLVMAGTDANGNDLKNATAESGYESTLYVDWGTCTPPCK